jgi:hypothetical protein
MFSGEKFGTLHKNKSRKIFLFVHFAENTAAYIRRRRAPNIYFNKKEREMLPLNPHKAHSNLSLRIPNLRFVDPTL